MKIFFGPDERMRYLGFDDRWAMLVGILLLSLVSVVLFTANEAELSPTKLGICIGIGLLHTSVYWFFSRLLVVNLRAHLPLQEQTGRRILLMVSAAIVLVVLVELLSGLLLKLMVTHGGATDYVKAPIAFEFVVSLTLILLAMGAYESVYFFTKYRHSLIEQERLAKANMQAQLAVLKQQVNPHFLFNSLNTLTNLIPEDSEKAVIFTQRLSAVYRRILEFRHEELIPLEEELKALRDYIYLMQTRFEDKLIVSWNEPKLPERHDNKVKVVPLTLQLLVENAIKHNVVSLATPLRIGISIDASKVTVTNSVRPRSYVAASTGWGQENIRQRYRMVTDLALGVECTTEYYRVTVPLLTDKNSLPYATA